MTAKALAMCAATLLALTGATQAGIIWSGADQDVTIGSRYDGDTAIISIAGSAGTWDDLCLHAYRGDHDGKVETEHQDYDNRVQSAVDDDDWVLNRVAGGVIDGTLQYRIGWNAMAGWDILDGGWHEDPTPLGITWGNFYNQTGYMALKLTGDLGETYYGWARVTTFGLPSQYTDWWSDDPRLVVHEWAYNNTPGATILVGQTVPEPATMVVLVLGGLFALVRRRRDA